MQAPGDLEASVVTHYASGDVNARIVAALDRIGAGYGPGVVKDLAPVDEFHIGGRAATEHAVAKLGLDAAQHVLDIGCGIGGPARYLASQIGCRVTGIDLTPDFVIAAEYLTERTGLSHLVTFRTASALDMPFDDGTFDAAITFHMAMNIADRAALYRETARVLKPHATFCVYDVMRGTREGLSFPVPWAAAPEISFLTSPGEMRDFLSNAGFDVLEMDDRSEFGITFFRERLAVPPEQAPPVGLHLLMGDARRKLENVLRGLEEDSIRAVMMVALLRRGFGGRRG